MAFVRLVNRRTGSVVVVDEERADSLKSLGLEPEKPSKPAAKKTASKSDK